MTHKCDRSCRYYRKYSFYTGTCGRFDATGHCKIVLHIAPDGSEEKTISPPEVHTARATVSAPRGIPPLTGGVH